MVCYGFVGVYWLGCVNLQWNVIRYKDLCQLWVVTTMLCVMKEVLSKTFC
jgi:hypothetical protein